jgi:hypothetical protein
MGFYGVLIYIRKHLDQTLQNKNRNTADYLTWMQSKPAGARLADRQVYLQIKYLGI